MMESYFLSNDIIRQLINSGHISESELKSIYRGLSKETHPDLTGGDSSEFLKIREEYRQAQSYLNVLKSQNGTHREQPFLSGNPGRTSPFSPTRIIFDSGFRRAIDPRAGLYVGLFRYAAAGLYSQRVRAKSTSNRRNLNIIRTVVYWAHLYDPEFISIFINYNRLHLVQYRDVVGDRKIIAGRRFFIQGLNWFVQFQDRGRSTAFEIGWETLSRAIDNLQLAQRSPLRRSLLSFAEWLRTELEKGSVCLKLA